MLGLKLLAPLILGSRQLSTTSCTLQKSGQMKKQVHMLKKIMTGGREKGKRRFVYSDNLPKVEGVKKLSDSKGQGKESNRRITVLNKLFMKNITDLMATDTFAKNVAGYGIQVTVVKVSPDFKSVNVFWLGQGDENDIEIEKILKSIAGPLRHELSQLRLMGEVPRIYFVRDKFYSKAAEVDALLRKADFGEDFEPTDPTLFMRSNLQIQMKLPEDIKMKIYEIEREWDDKEDFVEEELPEMRHDVMGIDHEAMMKKIASNIDKSKRAWETFETRSETILGDANIQRDLPAIKNEINKLNREADHRSDFVKFLERKQFAKKNTPERKKYKDLSPYEDVEDKEEYRDQPDGDFIEEDDGHKK